MFFGCIKRFSSNVIDIVEVDTTKDSGYFEQYSAYLGTIKAKASFIVITNRREMFNSGAFYDCIRYMRQYKDRHFSKQDNYGFVGIIRINPVGTNEEDGREIIRDCYKWAG